jgi:hypothetical protein
MKVAITMGKQSVGWLFLGAMFLVGGCTLPVKIDQPTGSETGPITVFKVHFDKDYVPGTFSADLSGTNITPLFLPAPIAGGVSTASINFPLFMDYDWINTVNGSGRPNEQLLRVSGKSSSNGSCCDSVTFSPPYTAIFRGGGTAVTFDHDLTLKERETITATVFVSEAPKESLKVWVLGDEAVSLNDQPAGKSIMVTIPTNDRRVDFTVRGIVVSGGGGPYFRIRAIATGYSSQVAGGRVNPAQ